MTKAPDTMIKDFRDQSANERTYLAWIRTAISIMAFGFLIEKVDLFLSYLGRTGGGDRSLQGSPFAEMVGLGLFALGALIVIGASWRFFYYQRYIETKDPIPYGQHRSNLVLSALIVLMSFFLAIYILRELF